MEKVSVCLDTSVLIDYFRKKVKERTLFYRLSGEYQRLTITAITEFEIRRGLTSVQEPIWQNLVEMMNVLPFDSHASRIAVEVDRTLKRKRKQIAIADLFIAATVIRHETALATLNKKHFERIDNLLLVE
ncbi:MAG: type II toxin-antitoxin system VapC family toxin [Pacificimonas sp.]